MAESTGEAATSSSTESPSSEASPGTSTEAPQESTGEPMGDTSSDSEASDESGGPPEPPPLDCGPQGVAIENAGPPENRVNYVILGDGYSAEEVDTTFLEHIEFAMVKRFDDVIGEPYLRYRKFVNICAIQIVSEGSICGNSALGCCGDDQSRLATCDSQAANQAIANALPETFEVDWKAVVLNGDSWWNTGSVLMLWSGAHGDADGAALHEGGHGFHQLADEYTSNSTCSREEWEVNSTADPDQTAGKWDLWLGYEQLPGTGEQGSFLGSRYCTQGQWRPSDNSMMNSLFGDADDTAFNAVSREKMIMDIWRIVTPVDAVEPPEGDVPAGSTLTVHVIDPEVIDVDWAVDDTVVSEDGGSRFDLADAGLSSGTHTITARAYDNAGEDLVRYRDGGEHGRENWSRSQQTVTWTVTVP